MPSRPKRPCSYPGCPKLIDGQYCEDHAAVARRQYNKYQRAPDINKKYGRAWKRIRDRHISQHPLCEQCEKAYHRNREEMERAGRKMSGYGMEHDRKDQKGEKRFTRDV